MADRQGFWLAICFFLANRKLLLSVESLCYLSAKSMCQAGFSLWLVTFTSWMHCSNQPTSCISANFEIMEKTCKLKHTQCILSDCKQYQGCLERALDLFQSGFNETLVFAYWATCIGAGQPIMSVKPSSASLYHTRHALTKICNVLVCLSDETTA